jgi:hypothetical protein
MLEALETRRVDRDQALIGRNHVGEKSASPVTPGSAEAAWQESRPARQLDSEVRASVPDSVPIQRRPRAATSNGVSDRQTPTGCTGQILAPSRVTA